MNRKQNLKSCPARVFALRVTVAGFAAIMASLS
jgi:hypothetical protein